MNKIARLLAGTCVAAVALTGAVSTPAVAQSDNWNALYDRIIRIEHQVRAMQGSGGSGAGQGDASYRLSTIEEQLRQLLGSVGAIRDQMRDMQNRIRRLEKQKSGSSQTQQYAQSDTQQLTQSDQSLSSYPTSSFESYDTDSGDLDLTVLPEGSDTASGEIYTGSQPLAQYEQPAQGQVLGQLIIKNDPGISGNDSGKSSLLPGQVESAALDNPTASGGGDADGLYKSSYRNLLDRRFGMAEAGFKTFLSKNPKHPSASKAQYWLGETYYVQGRYKQAAQSFLKGYRNYPKGARAAESLLKLGMSLNKLGQKKQACGAYAEVKRSYPSAKEASQQAGRESQRAGC